MRLMISIVGVSGLCLAIGCGGGGGGEPITGTIAIDYGTEHITPSVGAAVEDPQEPGQVYVIMGTTNVDCGTDLESDSPSNGTYVLFSIVPVVGAVSPFVSVLRIESQSFSSNSTSGDVMIDAVGERITGSLSNFSTTDDEVGTITAGGTFDVINCM
jgi:hypothetical protein